MYELAPQVFPAQDMDGKMFFPKPPPKRQLANPVALAALVDLLASEEEAVLHPALTLLVTVVRGGLEIPLSAGARGRIVVRCLRHACEGRCAELCAELLGAEAVAAPPARLSDGGMGGAGKSGINLVMESSFKLCKALVLEVGCKLGNEQVL